jgi:hypothetical protein
VICGHLCVVDGAKISDFDRAPFSKQVRLRQAMELDADVAALNFYWIERMLRMTEKRTSFLYGEGGDGAYLRDIGAAFGMLFSLWDKLSSGDAASSLHPTIITRAVNWSLSSGFIFQKYKLVDPEIAFSSLLSGFASIVGSLSLVDGTLHEKIGKSDDLVAYRNELLKYPLFRKRPSLFAVDFLKYGA